MTKKKKPKNLQKIEFIWAFTSRGIRVHDGSEAWWQAAAMATGTGS